MNFMKNVCTILTLVLCLVFTQSAMAITTPTNSADVKTEVVEKEMTKKEVRQLKKQERKAERLKKRIAKFEKKMERRGSDDSKKWMWFWILGWGAALVLPIIALAIGTSGGFGIAGVLLLLAGLAGTFGTISLIVWLVKKFA